MVWFSKLKTYYGFHNVKLLGEAKSADENTSASYSDRFRDIIEEGGYKPNQVFNMDDTGLQQKKLPDHMHIMREKSAPASRHLRTVSPSCWDLA